MPKHEREVKIHKIQCLCCKRYIAVYLRLRYIEKKYGYYRTGWDWMERAQCQFCGEFCYAGPQEYASRFDKIKCVFKLIFSQWWKR